MSLNNIIGDLQTGTYTVTRVAAGTRELGRYTHGAVTTFTVVAGIEPVTGRELKDLPEGQRGDEVVKIYTATELRTRTAGGEPDVITYRGEPWTVTGSTFWEGFGESHYECTACRAPSEAGVVP